MLDKVIYSIPFSAVEACSVVRERGYDGVNEPIDGELDAVFGTAEQSSISQRLMRGRTCNEDNSDLAEVSFSVTERGRRIKPQCKIKRPAEETNRLNKKDRRLGLTG